VAHRAVFDIVDDAEQCLVTFGSPLVLIDMSACTHTTQLRLL